MKEIMGRLARLIIQEMDKKNQSCLQFAELCGIDRSVMGNIINQKKTDIRLSTIVKICENSDIRIEHIFCDCRIEDVMRNAVMIIGGREYRIELKEK